MTSAAAVSPRAAPVPVSPRRWRALRALVEVYAAGVNAWLDAHGDSLPLEFKLLRYAPRRWETVDSIAVGKLLAMDLAQGWDDEALRARAYDRLPADVQAMLFPRLF